PDTNCDRYAKVHSQSSHADPTHRGTAGAKNRKGDASIIPRTRDARVDANAEAGLSAQPATGGQRDADRKTLKGKEPQERRIDRERCLYDRGSKAATGPIDPGGARTSPCAM